MELVEIDRHALLKTFE